MLPGFDYPKVAESTIDDFTGSKVVHTKYEKLYHSKGQFNYKFSKIDEGYLALFDMQITAGRYFSFDFSYNIENQVIINETTAHMAGLTDPVGKKIEKWGQEMEIIGVVKDLH